MRQTPMPGRSKPMPRGKALERRTPMPRGDAQLARVTQIRPVSKKREAENRERRKVVKATFSEHPVCAVPWCGRLADDVHEPLMRSRGGSIVDPANMAPLCRPCHDGITDTQPDWAYNLGLLAHSWDGGDAA
jgi:hypothetical protein